MKHNSNKKRRSMTPRNWHLVKEPREALPAPRACAEPKVFVGGALLAAATRETSETPYHSDARGDRGGPYPRELSAGQQQRVAIAHALAMEPEVRLFDEPTDPEMRDEVRAVRRDLANGRIAMLVAALKDPTRMVVQLLEAQAPLSKFEFRRSRRRTPE